MAQEIADSKLLDTWGSGGTKIEPDISKIIEGWQLGEQPPHEYMNWLQNTFGSKLNHILKNGIAKWNDETEYLSGATIQHNGDIWICQETNVNSEPTDTNNNWDKIPSLENLALTVDTINDFPASATTGDTCIVKDLDRGGIFIYDSTKVSEDNKGTNFNGWIRQYSGAVNVKWFGAKGDGITDDTSIIQSVLNTFSSVFIPKESFSYKVSRLTINNGQRIDSNGAEIIFTDLSSCLEFDNKNNIICNNIIFNSQQNGVLLGNFKNGSYDITFNNCEFKGNSNLDTQVGLGFTNSFIISFNSCYIKNFGVNVRFGTQANRIVFTSCSIRSSQTNNITLIRIEGGVNNSFIGCDIENCITLVDNGNITSIEDNASINITNCYLESSLYVNNLKYGSFIFENCYIADMRFAYYSTTDTVIFQNNVIRKVGTSFFLYFMDIAPSSITIQNNYIQYDTANPTTTGLIYRGYDGGIQYVSNGNISSPTYANATLGSDISINQTRVWDVNTSTIKHEIIESGVAYTSMSGGLTLGGSLISSGITFQNNSDFLTIKDGQWNQGHIRFLNSNVHMWIVPSGAGTSTLRIKYGTPTYNTDGVAIATF